MHTKLNGALKILLATNAMILTAGAMLGPIYALFVADVGGDLMDASIAGGIFAFVAGIVTLLSGKYSDSVKENELIMVLGYCVMGIGFLLYLWANSVIVLFIIQAIIGLGEAIYSPAFDAIYSNNIEKESSGSQWSLWEAMNYFVTAIGACIGGVVATYLGFNALFVIMSLLCFGSGIYIYRLQRDIL